MVFEYTGAFADGNGKTVRVGDLVEYRFGARKGTMIDILQDGDAEVLFHDNMNHEMVKWHHLCKLEK